MKFKKNRENQGYFCHMLKISLSLSPLESIDPNTSKQQLIKSWCIN